MRRQLSVWVDCEDETCGGCEMREGWHCCQFHVALDGAGSAARCPDCIAAESRALSVAGIAEPEVRSPGGHTIKRVIGVDPADGGGVTTVCRMTLPNGSTVNLVADSSVPPDEWRFVDAHSQRRAAGPEHQDTKGLGACEGRNIQTIDSGEDDLSLRPVVRVRVAVADGGSEWSGE